MSSKYCKKPQKLLLRCNVLKAQNFMYVLITVQTGSSKIVLCNELKEMFECDYFWRYVQVKSIYQILAISLIIHSPLFKHRSMHSKRS